MGYQVGEKMKYKHIDKKKLYEKVADAIHEMILEEQIKPGDKLDSIKELSEHFQVSSQSVREALYILKATGIIDIKQGKGTFVNLFDK